MNGSCRDEVYFSSALIKNRKSLPVFLSLKTSKKLPTNYVVLRVLRDVKNDARCFFLILSPTHLPFPTPANLFLNSRSNKDRSFDLLLDSKKCCYHHVQQFRQRAFPHQQRVQPNLRGRVAAWPGYFASCCCFVNTGSWITSVSWYILWIALICCAQAKLVSWCKTWLCAYSIA